MIDVTISAIFRLFVVDFILVAQIILLCVLTTEVLTTGPDGLMLESFVFFLLHRIVLK